MKLPRNQAINVLLRSLAQLPNPEQAKPAEGCPQDESLLWALADGELGEALEQETLDHVCGCRRCAERLHEIAGAMRGVAEENGWSFDRVRRLIEERDREERVSSIPEKVKTAAAETIRLGRLVVAFLATGFDRFEPVPVIATVTRTKADAKAAGLPRAARYRARAGQTELTITFEEKAGREDRLDMVCDWAEAKPAGDASAASAADAELDLFGANGDFLESARLADLPARFELPCGGGELRLRTPGRESTLLRWEIRL